ncbi:S-layer family protein [Bacillus oleivorans]|uniref:S-layer family protein n=1 Tax=Bacillus oleivorans TaxID=1448271 RepID=A0A285CID2_9BACI|nr:carboxypeptidase regulatory-like domain-containing protein [Bacillus oleivorans]SNX67352.1 S-layer family protein [Bacillus oleivorans]
MSYKPKTHRKFMATAATATLVATAVAPVASAAEFTDVSSKYKEAVDYLVAKEITSGLTPTQFGVSKEIKRADAAVMIAKALGLDGTNAPASGFTDVPDRAVKAVNALKAAGIVNGKTATTFGAHDSLTRGEMALILAKAYEISGDVELKFTDVIGTRYEAAVQAMVANEITSGKTATSFAVGQNITRGEFAIFLHKADTLEVLASGIAGFVFDGSKPVTGATVKIAGKTAKTNEEGYYELLNVQPGSHTVSVEANGYKTVTAANVKVVADEVTSFTTDIDGQEIDTTAIAVSGVVIDGETGAAINGADVTLESYDEVAKAWTKVAGVTTIAGSYVIDQEDASSKLQLGAEYRLTVSFDGYKDNVQTITLDSQEVANVLNGIELDDIEVLDITGTVTDAAGKVVSGAEVTVYDAQGTEVATTTTNTEGKYSVADVQLVSGTYNVVVDHAGSAVSYTEFTVQEGTNATHNVKLEAGYTVSAGFGTVSLSDSFNAEATYTLEILNGNTVIGKQDVTGSDSTLSFDFSRIAPGQYTLRLSGDFVETKEFSVTVDGNETVEERVTPAGTVSGTTAVANGVKVDLIDVNGNVVDSTEVVNGTYTFTSVSAGTYKVQASGADFVAETSAEFTVSKNTNTEVPALDLDNVVTTGDVAGYVRTSGTLTAVAGATVTYYDEKGEEVATVTTNASGAYSLSDLAAGTYEVVVRGTGVETYTTAQAVKAGDNLSAVNYAVTKGGNASLKLSVVDSEGKPVDVAINGFDLADAFVDPTSPQVGTWEGAAAVSNTITFNNLPAGTYELNIDVASAEFVDVEKAVSVAKGEAAELKIVVDKVAAQRDVNFRVVDEANANVNGAKVVVFKADGSIKEILTTSAGTAELALVDGNYTLAVYQNGYLAAEKEITVAGAAVNVPVIQLTPVK